MTISFGFGSLPNPVRRCSVILEQRHRQAHTRSALSDTPYTDPLEGQFK
jgi:hypothetical protein